MTTPIESHASNYPDMEGYLTPEEVSSLRGPRNGIPVHEIFHAAHCMVSERVTGYSPYHDATIDLVYALLVRRKEELAELKEQNETLTQVNAEFHDTIQRLGEKLAAQEAGRG